MKSQYSQYLASIDRVAPERPKDAPPINYGGKHPFENNELNNNAFDRNLRRGLQKDSDYFDGDGEVSEDVNYNSSDPYEPIRIKFDIEEVLKVTEDGDERVERLIGVLNEVDMFWSNLLSVIPVEGELVVVGGSSISERCPDDKSVKDSDLLIVVTANIACSVEGVLASAVSCERDQFDRPVIGSIDFCLDEIETSTRSTKRTRDIAIHEIGHVLGFNSYSISFFRNPETGEALTSRPLQVKQAKCVNGQEMSVYVPGENTLRLVEKDDGSRQYIVVTPTVRTVARNHFDCQTLEGAQLENQPTSLDCFGSHWDERYFYTESMSAFYDYASNILSPLTLAYFEDSGWYKANYTASSVSHFGHKAGCGFVEGKCIVDETLPSYSKGFFCAQSSIQTCDPTHSIKSDCDLFDLSETEQNLSDAPPDRYQYFGSPYIRPKYFTRADYCPIAHLNGIWCANPSFFSMSSGFEYLGEKFSEDSKCFNTDDNRSLCLIANCNFESKALEITIGDETLVCDRDFDLKKIPGSDINVECPRIAQICPDLFCPANCAGRGICDYNSSAICTDGVCRYKATCRCFNQNDTSPFCIDTTIQGPNDLIEDSPEMLPAISAVGGLCVGLVIIFFLWKWKQDRDRR